MRGALSRVGPFILLLTVLIALVLGPGPEQPLVYHPHQRPEDADAQGARMSWSVDQIIAAYSGGDPGSYARDGKLFFESQRFELPAAATWPPGMPLLVAAVLALTGPDDYPFKLALISALAWALALFFLVDVTGARGGDRWILTLTAMTMLLLPGLRQWTFGFGSLMSESISCALFVSSWAAFIAAVFGERRRNFVLAGVLLGCAASFRSYFGPMASAMCAAPMLLFAWRGRKDIAPALRLVGDSVRSRAWRTGLPARGSNIYLSSGFALALLASQAVLTPYEIYKSVVLNSRISTVTRVIFGPSWRSGNDDAYHFQRTDNTACKVDPALCKILAQHPGELRLGQHRNLAIMTMATNPARWYAHKARDFDYFWLGADSATVLQERPLLFIEGAAQLLLGALGFVLLIRTARENRSGATLGLCLMLATFFLLNFVLFTFLQYEWRYSQAMRQLCFLLPLVAFAARARAPRGCSTPT